MTCFIVTFVKHTSAPQGSQVSDYAVNQGLGRADVAAVSHLHGGCCDCTVLYIVTGIREESKMDAFTSSLWVMLLKGVGVGMVAALISIFVYFGLIIDRYSNNSMTIRIHLERALFFSAGLGSVL